VNARDFADTSGTKAGGRTGTRSIPELVAVIERTEALRAVHAPSSEEWQKASKQIATLLEEMHRRTAAALGNAFAATLMGLSPRELDVADAAGDRLLIELRKRGLSVLPRRFVPPG
jgi:hypothetical protein